MLLEKWCRKTCSTQGCHKPSICKKGNTVSAKCIKTRSACSLSKAQQFALSHTAETWNQVCAPGIGAGDVLSISFSLLPQHISAHWPISQQEVQDQGKSRHSPQAQKGMPKNSVIKINTILKTQNSCQKKNYEQNSNTDRIKSYTCRAQPHRLTLTPALSDPAYFILFYFISFIFGCTTRHMES